MVYSKELREVLKAHKEINENEFVPLILDVYLRCGAGELAALKDILAEALGQDGSKHYNRAVAKIVKMLVKNSDLLSED